MAFNQETREKAGMNLASRWLPYQSSVRRLRPAIEENSTRTLRVMGGLPVGIYSAQQWSRTLTGHERITGREYDEALPPITGDGLGQCSSTSAAALAHEAVAV